MDQQSNSLSRELSSNFPPKEALKLSGNVLPDNTNNDNISVVLPVKNFNEVFDAVNAKYNAIVNSMPRDYLKTLHQLQDYISDDQISIILGCPNHIASNRMILDYLMEKMQYKDDVLNLCDQLDRISDSPTLSSLIVDIRKATSLSPTNNKATLTTSVNLVIPPSISSSKEFVPLARRYTNLVMSMPPNYQKTLHHLQDHISDDQISTILECRDYVTSNKMILDCLVMKVHCKDDLLNLCDQLSNVTGSPTMLGLVNDIRKDIATAVVTPALNFITCEQRKDIIGRYYSRLCHCLPSNHNKVVDKLLPMKLFNANAFESIYTAKNKSEAIVDVVIVSTAPVHECVVICEVLENLIEDDTHKSVIEELKYELRMWKFDNHLKFDHHRGVIRYYYHRLCQCMPSNHKNSVGVLLQMNLLSDEAVQFVYNNCRTEGSRNETIIDTLIVNCGKSTDFLVLCVALERLSTEPVMKEVIDALKSDYVWELEKAEYVSSNHQSSSKEQKASKTIQTQLETTCKEGDHTMELSFVAESRPWTLEDFLGSPTDIEICALSVTLASLSLSYSDTQDGRMLRVKLMGKLDVEFTKIFEIELAGSAAASFEDSEQRKFSKLFKEWLQTEETLTRIMLLRALISEVEDIVPQALKDMFFIACKELQVPHPQQAELGYLDILQHGTVPLISVPVCLMGFCEAGKSSLSHLLTGTKLPKAANSTKVAVSYPVTAGNSKGPWEIRTKKQNEQALASAFKSVKSKQTLASSGKHPAKILGSTFDNLQPSTDTKQSPTVPTSTNDVLQTSSDFCSIASDFSVSPEVILQILDCGGQPMYLEAIPLLVGPRCIYCIVYNLMWKLDDYAVIKFWKDGALLQQNVSSKTYLEHIVEWISIIDCQFSKECDGQDQPTALFIGTHFDVFAKEMFNNDRMEARIAVCSIFERIRAAVVDRLYSCDLHIEPFYVDNTTAGTPYEDAAASDLRSLVVKIAMKYSILAMPLSWLCLLYSLQYSSKTPHFAKHLTEVQDIAISCGVKREELGMCLQVLHRLSMLLYFHKIEDLKNYVFTDLNCFFQELGKIFTVSCKSLYENEWKHLQRTGIVTNRLQSLLFEGEFIKGWSLRVFKFLGLAGTVERDTKTAIIPGPFFENSFSLPIFPSMIDATANSLPLKEFITFPDGKSLSPLFFVFSPDEAIQYGLMQYTPPGFFTQLISKLTEGCLFGIVLDAMDEPKTPSYSNQFTFRFGKLEIDNVTIRKHSDCIQVTVERRATENLPEFQPPEEICSFIGKEICNTGQSILQQWMPRITIQPCFFCRHCCEDHFAAVYKMGPPILLNCTKTMTIYKASPQEIMWLKML
ncbi:uncharacterized protein [Dysidea avara]